MLHTTKLLACFLLCLSCFSCDSKKRTSSKNTPTEQIKEQGKSALQQQILLMLRGEPHDGNILRTEIELQGWEKTEKELLTCIDLHTQEHGKRPEKKYIGRAWSRLGLINSQIELALSEERRQESERAKKESLQRLERSIQKAVEKEKSRSR